MTRHLVSHDTIRIERGYSAAPARVFAAWADPDIRRCWDVPGGDWERVGPAPDFRVGGREVSRFGPPGDPIYRMDARYEDIVPGARIVFAYTIARGETRISASLTTVELAPAGTGTRLVLTDQVAFLDGGDTPIERARGWRSILDKLAAALADADA